jgi:serine protease DegQ
MRRLWLLFSQAVTVALALLFVVATLKPEWAAERAAPAVVSIVASQASRPPQGDDPWFRFFFGDPRRSRAVGLGSGVIVAPEGYLLTNNHVVEGADEIEVSWPTAARHRRAGRHRPRDRPGGAARSSSTRCRSSPGRHARAAGRRRGAGHRQPLQRRPDGHLGIVSALGRNRLGLSTFENFIQTDAAINPGNSGGALVDAEGHLVGINTAIYSPQRRQHGHRLRDPGRFRAQVLDALVRDGRCTRGWIGVEPRDLTPELAAQPAPAGQPGRADHRRAARRTGQPRRHAPGRRGGRHRRPR